MQKFYFACSLIFSCYMCVNHSIKVSNLLFCFQKFIFVLLINIHCILPSNLFLIYLWLKNVLCKMKWKMGFMWYLMKRHWNDFSSKCYINWHSSVLTLHNYHICTNEFVSLTNCYSLIFQLTLLHESSSSFSSF